MKRIFVLLMVINFGFIPILFSQKREAVLKIATFDVNATPTIGDQPTNDKMENRPDLSLRAKGVVLIGSGKPIVLCAIDWYGIGNESQDTYKLALAEAAGTIPERIVVHTLHQFGAPFSDRTTENFLKAQGLDGKRFESKYDLAVIGNIQNAIRSSLSEAQIITEIGIGKAPVYNVTDVAQTYSTGSEVVNKSGDPEVTLISFWNNNEPLAVLSFYAAKPQIPDVGQVPSLNFLVKARSVRQQAVPEALHVHFNGAGGNVSTKKTNSDSYKNGLILAERFADGMKRAWENTEKSKINAKELQWITIPMFLPYDEKEVSQIGKFSPRDVFEPHLNDSANIKGKSAEIAESKEEMSGDKTERSGWYKRRMEGKSTEAACLAFNDIRILFMPGNLFVEYQVAAKSMASDKYIAMAAYGDSGPSTIGTKESLMSNGKVANQPLSAELEEYVMRTIRALLEEADKNYGGLLSLTDDKGKRRTVTNKESWEERRNEILENMEKVMGELPTDYTHLGVVSYTDSLQTEFYTRYTINYQIAPFDTVYAYLYKPFGNKKKHPAILALHTTNAAGKRQIDNTTKNRGYAKELAERGYVVISPDFPGFGDLRGYDFENDSYESGTMKGIFNHISCVSFLETLDYVDKDKIGVIGHSLGGHNALWVAAFEPRIKVIVASSAWTLFDYYNAGERITKLFGGRLGAWAQDRYMPLIRTKYDLDPEKLPVDFDEMIATLAPRPVFSNSPLFDYFSIEGVRKGGERIQEVYHFLGAPENFVIVSPEYGHDFQKEVREQAYNFFDKYFK